MVLPGVYDSAHCTKRELKLMYTDLSHLWYVDEIYVILLISPAKRSYLNSTLFFK